LRRFLAASLLFFTALTAVMTYPQMLHMHDRVHDDGDPLLHTWILAWVAHQLPRAPAHIFDANIFYPERRTLAYSDALLLPGVLAAPLHWAGVPPLVVHNVVFLSGFIVSGAGMALLVRTLTGSTGAGLLAGIIFAFLPYRIDHFPHLQLQQTQCLPFAFWAFHRLLRTGRIRDGALLGVFAAGQVLSCLYYGLFLIPYMGVVCGTMLVSEYVGRRRLQPDVPNVTRRLVPLLVSMCIIAVAVTPLLIAYLGARKVVGERGRQETMDGSATWENYLAPAEANLMYGKVFERFMQPERRLFPGFAAIALAIVGLWPPLSPTRLAYGLGVLLAFDVSLGFNGLIYPLLYDYVLPFRALRVPARMGLFTGFSLAVLAGYGVTRIVDRLQTHAARQAMFVVVGLVMLAEYVSRPLELATIPTSAPEAYADIIRDRGDSPTAVLYEFPSSALDDPTYLYYSTFHWQYLVNGYSGFFPPSYVRLARAVQNFPDQASFDTIKSHGVRYLVVHGERLYGERYETLIADLDKRRDLLLVSRRPWFDHGKHSEISAYRLLYAP
jgi:hypothetical protein